ncbi:MAG: PAS domain S-box protein, partial [Panacibacter sp.]
IIVKPGDALLVKSVFPEEVLAYWESSYKRALAGESFKEEIFTPGFKKSKAIWTETCFSPIQKADAIVGVACFLRNITERKSAEEKITQSEAHLAEAQRLAKMGSWNFDVKADKLTWSDELYNVFGTDKQTFIETHSSFTDLVDEADREFVLQTSKQTQETGKPFTIEYNITTPKGEKRVIQEHGYGEVDNKGNVSRLFGTAQNITESKKSKAALQNAYEEKNTLLERIDDGFFALDENSVVTYWNKRAEILLDTKKEDLIGKNLHEVFTVRGSRIFYDNYVKALREKITIHFEGFSNISKKWFAVSAYGSDNGLSVYFKDVTVQKGAEEKLKESELRYRSIIEQATDAICIADASMKIIDVNHYCCEMLGYTKKEFLPLTVADLFVQEDLKENPFKIGELMSGKVIRNERRFKRKDGTIIEVEMSGRILDDGRFILFGHDIAERKKAEEKIKESELRYRSLNEQATDTICILDSSFRFIDVNNSGCLMFGCTREEVLQLYMTDVLFEEDLKTNPIKIDELKAGKATSNERRVKRKDGSAILVELSSKMLEDGRIMVFGRDISERKESERLIKESEAKYRSFFESSMDGILLTVTDGEILSANPAACEIFKMTEEEICVAGRFGVVDLEDPRLFKLIEERQRTGKAKGEITLVRKDGSKFEAELTSAVFTDSYGRERTSMIVRDITRRKQAELRIQESNERYNLISQATNDMVWDWDLVTGKVYRNKEGWKKIFRTRDTAIENGLIDDWDNRIHPEDQETVKLVNDEIQKLEKDFFEVECRMLRDDGTYAYIHDRGNIIRNEQGKAIRLIGATQDITARKEAELQVTKSELRFRSLVQNGSDLISILDENTTYLYTSPASKRILGYEPEYMIGKSALSFIHPDDIGLLHAYMEKIKLGTYIEVTPFRFKNASGNWKWLESKITDMRDNPEVQGYVVNSRDVTERKTAEEEIKKLSVIARETSNAVIITNPEGEIVWVNEGFTKITEFEFDEVIGKKPGDFLQGEETNLAVVRFMRNKLKNAEPFECDIINYSKTGRKYWLRIQSQPQFDETGKLNYFFAIETDITKEKEAEEILRASEEQYRYLFNNNPACVFIWDIENFQILEVNDTAVRLYGYHREEFLTKTTFDLSLSEDYNKIKHFASIARQKNEFRSEVTCKHINKSGDEMYMHIRSHLIHLKGRTVILTMATDITDRIILENELENER